MATCGQPTVTLVTPTFNQADFLEATIESVLGQDYPNIDFIVIDDGSTDATPEVLSKFNGRVRVCRHKNMGQVRTLNEGWGAARGKYLSYLSSDDLLEPNAISAMVAALESNAELVCAFPNSDLIDAQGRIIKRSVCKPFSLEQTLVSQECQIGPGAVFRRDAYQRIGGWDPSFRLAPDREFWLRLAREGTFHFDDRALAKYRLHVRATSYRVVSDEVTKEYIDVLDRFFESNPPADLLARRDEAYGHAFMVRARNAFRSGNFRGGWQHYAEACRLHPPLRSITVKGSLLRTVVSKPLRIAASRIRSLLNSRG